MSSNKIDVEKFLNLTKFVNAVEEGGRLNAGQIAENFAKRFVQVDTGNLANSIRWDGKDSITANTEYAAVQEYGRPGMQLDPNRIVDFGYTPFLRPAAQATAQFINDNAQNTVTKIINAALRVARI